MKVKYFSIFLFLFLLICCANTVYAVSDDNILELDQSEDIISANGEDMLSVSNDDALSSAQDDIVLTDTADGNSTAAGDTQSTTTTSSVSPYKQFSKDLSSGASTVNLTGDITISKPFEIRRDVVIDGQGHTIDAQKKTNIFKIYKSTVTIKNLILKNGKSDRGGAIYASGAKVNIKGCTFKWNKASGDGGAVYCLNGKLTVDKSTFTNNYASNGGGVYVTGAPATIKNSKFKDNKAESSSKTGHGGALYVCKKPSTITNCTFTKNYCLSKKLKAHKNAVKYDFSGGAVFLNQGSKHIITGCTFTSNKASNHGGAVYSFRSKYVKLDKCTFKTNKVAFEDGGAVTFNGDKLLIKNCNFEKNHAYEDGGVMDACSLASYKVHVTITGSVFKSNTGYKGGGSIWMGKKSVFTMKNNKFISNAAGIGGALFAEDTTAKITKCVFQGNKAKKVAPFKMTTKAGGVLKHCGGAIMMQKKTIKLIKNTFKKNRATYGGAIFQKGGKLVNTSNKFSGNKASKSGNNIKR